MAFKICQEVPTACLDISQIASLSLAQGRLADRSCSLLPCLRKHGTSIEISCFLFCVCVCVCFSFAKHIIVFQRVHTCFTVPVFLYLRFPRPMFIGVGRYQCFPGAVFLYLCFPRSMFIRVGRYQCETLVMGNIAIGKTLISAILAIGIFFPGKHLATGRHWSREKCSYWETLVPGNT